MRRILAVPIFPVILLFLFTPAHALNHDLLTNVEYFYETILHFESNPFPADSFYRTNAFSGPGKGPHFIDSHYVPDYYVSSYPLELKAEISPYEVHASATLLEYDWADVVASAGWFFIPKYDNVKVNVEGFAYASTFASYSYAEFAFRLYDYTDDRFIANVDRSIQAGPGPENTPAEDYFSRHYLLAKDHTYGMELFGTVVPSDFARAKVKAKFSVPEPAVMILIGTGLLGLAVCRKSRLRRA